MAAMRRHAKQYDSNLGVPITAALAGTLKAPAYVVDALSLDGLFAEADTSGFYEIIGHDISRVLRICAAARKAAQSVGRPLEDINLVVGHLDADMTIAAIQNGRMTDSDIARLQEGVLAPQPPEQPPLSEPIDPCREKQFTWAQCNEALTRHGERQTCLGERRLKEIESEINAGNEYARRTIDAISYQIAKGIGAMYVAAGCDVEAIILTGGMMRIERVRNDLKRRVGRMAPLLFFEQDIEMETLAREALRVLDGQSKARRRLRKQPDTSSKRRIPT
jgi:butyrate kinase